MANIISFSTKNGNDSDNQLINLELLSSCFFDSNKKVITLTLNTGEVFNFSSVCYGGDGEQNRYKNICIVLAKPAGNQVYNIDGYIE